MSQNSFLLYSRSFASDARIEQKDEKCECLINASQTREQHFAFTLISIDHWTKNKVENNENGIDLYAVFGVLSARFSHANSLCVFRIHTGIEGDSERQTEKSKLMSE